MHRSVCDNVHPIEDQPYPHPTLFPELNTEESCRGKLEITKLSAKIELLERVLEDTAKREKQWQVKFEDLQAQILSGEETTFRNSRFAVQSKCVSHNPPHENRPKWTGLGGVFKWPSHDDVSKKKSHPRRASGGSTKYASTNALWENVVCDETQDCMFEECQEAGRCACYERIKSRNSNGPQLVSAVTANFDKSLCQKIEDQKEKDIRALLQLVADIQKRNSSVLSEKKSTISELEFKVSGREAAIADHEKKLKLRDEMISGLRSRVLRRDEVIVDLKENSNLQAKEISALTSKLSVRKFFIEDLEKNSEMQAESILELRSELSRRDATISDLEKSNKVQAKSSSELYQAVIERERSRIEELGDGEIEKKSEVQNKSIFELRYQLQMNMEREKNLTKEIEQLRLWIEVWGVERELSLIKQVENLEKRVKMSEIMVINQAQSLKMVKFITAQLLNKSKSIIDDPTRQIKEEHVYTREFNTELERIHKLTNLAVSKIPISRRRSQ